MRIKKFNNFIYESLDKKEDIQNILYEVGAGPLTSMNAQKYQEEAPWGFKIYMFEKFRDKIDPEDIEVVKDRLEDIGVRLVCYDTPDSSDENWLAFLLCSTETYNQYKRAGYKFLEDIEWVEWELAKAYKSMFNSHTGFDGAKNTKRGQYPIGDDKMSIIKGSVSGWGYNEENRYEFMAPSEEDVSVYSGAVTAEMYHLWVQQKIFGANKVLKSKNYDEFH